jgi:hypothetical protein
MKLKQFRKNYSGAPISLQEMAELVVANKEDLVSCEKIGLVGRAIYFLEESRSFEKCLKEHNIVAG